MSETTLIGYTRAHHWTVSDATISRDEVVPQLHDGRVTSVPELSVVELITQWVHLINAEHPTRCWQRTSCGAFTSHSGEIHPVFR